MATGSGAMVAVSAKALGNALDVALDAAWATWCQRISQLPTRELLFPLYKDDSGRVPGAIGIDLVHMLCRRRFRCQQPQARLRQQQGKQPFRWFV